MAKTHDEDVKRPKSKVTEVAVWGLMAMLILGLGGFGVTSFSGRITSVGQVGDVEISAQDYASGLQQQVAAMAQQYGLQMSTQEALGFGFGEQVLQSLIARAALDDETTRIGLSVGDEVVASELITQDAFKGLSGTFDREAYRFQLDRMNQTEAEYEAGLRRQVARDLMQGVIGAGFAAPGAVTDAAFVWLGEKRAFSLLRLSEADLTTALPEPTDADLTAHYDANIDRFTKPEAKRITYVSLLPEAIAKDQPVDEAALQALYDSRIDEFVVPERRIVERLVYPDQAAAEAAKASLAAGTSFDDLVAERGLTLDAIDMGDVAQDELGEAGADVFALAEGEVAGPLPSDFGPALFRVVSVLAAQNITLDQARETLAPELQIELAKAQIADKVDLVDDLLAGGAELEDLVKEAGLTLATLDHVPGAPGTEPVEGYPAFREAADAVAEGDFPEAIILEDGGIVALRMDALVPSAPIPFDQARDAVIESWRAEALAKALSTRAIEISTDVATGGSIGAHGIVEVTASAGRDTVIEGAPESLIKDIFAMAEGSVQVVEAEGFIAVVKLDRVIAADTQSDEAKAERAMLATQIAQSISADALRAYTDALGTEAGISLDMNAITAVNSSLP